MPMEFLEITAAEQCHEQEIRARASASSKARHTRHYVVWQEGLTVAFLSLDLIPNVEYLVVYELFVPRALRRQGVGSRVLAEVERTLASHTPAWKSL